MSELKQVNKGMDGQTDAWTTRRTKQRMAFETHEQMKEKPS